MNAVVITNTLIRTFDVKIFNLTNQLRVLKKYINDVVLFVQENIHEIYKPYVESNLDG